MSAWGSADHHRRAIQPKTDMRQGARYCPYCPRGSKTRATHLGTANGIVLMSACEWHARMWARGRHLKVGGP